MDIKTRHAPSDLLIEARDEGATAEGYRGIELVTREGSVAARFYPADEPVGGALWVGGAGGDWDSPARDLYPRLCRSLGAGQVMSLRVRFRDPRNLVEAIHYVLAGVAYLQMKGADRIVLVGHSFGGAVVIQAGAMAKSVRGVVALATQSHGAEPAAWLAPHCALLLIHGENDTVLPATSSRQVYRLAQEPKQLLVYPGAGHGLDEVADKVEAVMREWIRNHLVAA